jgi:membrane-associated phospholipid phosphatase
MPERPTSGYAASTSSPAAPSPAAPSPAAPSPAAPSPVRPAGGPGHREGGRAALAQLLTGVALGVAVLLLGLLAMARPVARLDLRADQHIAAHDRSAALTSLARAATTAATPETVGIALMIAIPLLFLLARRRIDALKVFCMFAGAYALAEVAKKLIGEHRPPAALWALPADSSPSYPSGHATVAAVLTVALVAVTVTAAWRASALVAGILVTVLVAGSRVYLADHYPLDVIGSVTCALAAGFVVAGLAALPAVQPWLARLDTARRHR